MTIAVLFTFLSNNPEISFITKDQFHLNRYFFLSFSGVLYIFKRKDLDTDAVYTMLSLVAIIIISLLINYFSGNQNILFIDGNSLREWYGLPLVPPLVVSLELGFILLWEIVFGVVLDALWLQF
jgi:hypothetical protein